MSEYVGLKQGKVHESHVISEYYCGGCDWPVTDHDSYCSECGGELHEGMDKSRWHELFGTLERAARMWIECNGIHRCADCPMCHDERGVTCELPLGICAWMDEGRGYDALFEWLMGDADV